MKDYEFIPKTTAADIIALVVVVVAVGGSIVFTAISFVVWLFGGAK